MHTAWNQQHTVGIAVSIQNIPTDHLLCAHVMLGAGRGRMSPLLDKCQVCTSTSEKFPTTPLKNELRGDQLAYLSWSLKGAAAHRDRQKQ